MTLYFGKECKRCYYSKTNYDYWKYYYKCHVSRHFHGVDILGTCGVAKWHGNSRQRLITRIIDTMKLGTKNMDIPF